MKDDIYIRAKFQGPDDALLTRQEAADLMRVSTKTVDNWSKLGHFHRYWLGSEVRYLKSEVLQAWRALK